MAPQGIIDSWLVLVRQGSPKVLRFDHWQALQAGGAAPLTCDASHPGNGIGTMYPEERRFEEWRYTESKCVAARDACSVQLVQGKFLKRVDANLVLDVAFWKFHEGTAVNWVGGGSDDCTYLHGGGRDFRVNSDGSICLVDHPHLSLGLGDVVEAMDPVPTKWSPATVHAIAKNGLVEVRWDDPGMDNKGKPYHPIGEVWAEQIRLKWRPAPVVASTAQKTVATVEEEPPLPPDGLQIGDSCYAMGQVLTKTWFTAKLIGVRARSPPMRVEYIATLDGQTTELLLPSPRKDFVNVDQLRRDKPEVESTEISRRAALEKVALEEKEAKALEEKQASSQNDDDVVISPDLMCVVCERPDDEPNMLVCDCKKGYHIYCLTPALEEVPEGDWKCPKCAKK